MCIASYISIELLSCIFLTHNNIDYNFDNLLSGGIDYFNNTFDTFVACCSIFVNYIYLYQLNGNYIFVK